MIIPRSRHAIASCAVAALLAGCGGSQPPIGAPGATPQTFAAAAGANSGTSWMLAEAQNDDLLYVSDGGNNVYVFSYPLGALVGTLTGFNGADGECVDAAGNFFVTNALGTIIKYRHGGKKAVATLNDYGSFPLSCSVDPTTGNLAVTNYPGIYSQHGNVAIYRDARGAATHYVDSGVALYYACTYDARGNLYLDGSSASGFAFLEMPRGGHSFKNIHLSQHFQYPGAVLWDGKYVAVGTSNAGIIYRFGISGSSGRLVGKSVLSGVRNTSQALFWIQGDRVIVPFGASKQAKSNVGFWKYPAGGRYVKRIQDFGGQQLFGVTVSLAAH